MFQHGQDVLSCSCCGKGIRNDENVDRDAIPYPHDQGFGMCVDCGGDKEADTTTDEGLKQALGWAGRTFYEARFPVIRDGLNEGNKKKWDGLSYRKKVLLVGRMLEKGILKW